jgi:hypothetical protein
VLSAVSERRSPTRRELSTSRKHAGAETGAPAHTALSRVNLFSGERNRPGCQIRRRVGFPFDWTNKIDFVFGATPDSTSELTPMPALLRPRIMALEPQMQHPGAIFPRRIGETGGSRLFPGKSPSGGTSWIPN